MITTLGGDQPCHRCGEPLLLTAEAPEPQRPEIQRPLALCPCCDAHDPAAQGLLAWFAIHGTVDTDELPAVEALAEEWVAALLARPAGISVAQAEADAAAWRRGEFD